MADDTPKIDRALARICQQLKEHPQYHRAGFVQKGDPDYFIQWTSTCTDAPGRFPLYTETETTPLIYASIAEEGARLEAKWPGRKKDILAEIDKLYDRGRTTFDKAVRTPTDKALSLFKRST